MNTDISSICGAILKVTNGVKPTLDQVKGARSGFWKQVSAALQPHLTDERGHIVKALRLYKQYLRSRDQFQIELDQQIANYSQNNASIKEPFEVSEENQNVGRRSKDLPQQSPKACPEGPGNICTPEESKNNCSLDVNANNYTVKESQNNYTQEEFENCSPEDCENNIIQEEIENSWTSNECEKNIVANECDNNFTQDESQHSCISEEYENSQLIPYVGLKSRDCQTSKKHMQDADTLEWFVGASLLKELRDEPPSEDFNPSFGQAMESHSPATDYDSEIPLKEHDGRVKEPFDLKRVFSFQLSYNEWNALRPENSTRLQQGWTEIFNEKVRGAGNKYCVLSFKTGRVSSPRKGYRTAHMFRATAHCTHSFQGNNCLTFNFIIKKGTTTGQDLTVHVSSSGNFNHDAEQPRRRHFRRPKRLEIQRELKDYPPNQLKMKKVYQQKKEDVSVLMAGNYNRVPSQKIIQKISSEKNLEEVLDTCVWKDLEKRIQVINDRLEHDVFPVLSKKPFSVVWHTQQQVQFMRSIRGGKKKDKPLVTVHIDATGSVVAKVPWSDKKIMYYAIVIQGEKGKPSIPISECITSKHNVTSITNWLDTAMDDVNETSEFKVDIVVTDCSWAESHAVFRAIIETDAVSYMNLALSEMEKKSVSHTILIWCNSHTIHMVSRKVPKPNSEETRTARNLALHMFASLQRTHSLDEAKRIVHDMAIIFDTEKPHPLVLETVQMAEKRLAQMEWTFEFPEEDMDIGEDEDVEKERDKRFSTNQTMYSKSPFYHIFKEASEVHFGSEDRDISQQEDCKEEEPNEKEVKKQKNSPFYLKGFLKYLLTYVLPYYPLWSCALLKLVDKSVEKPLSNWPSEIHFKNVKQAPMKLYLRPSLFILRRVDYNQELLASVQFNPDFARPVKRKMTSTSLRGTEEIWRPHKKKRKGSAYSIGQAKQLFAKRISKRYLSPKKPFGVPRPVDCRTPQTTQALEEALGCTSPVIEAQEAVTPHGDEEMNHPMVDLQRSIVPRKLSFEDTSNVDENGSMHQSTISHVPWKNAAIPINWENYGTTIILPNGDEILTERVKTLQHEGWLSDDVINAFFNTRSVVAESHNVKVLPFDSYFLSSLKSGSTGYLTYGERVNCMQYDIWLCPYNAHENHWSVLIVVLKKKIVLYLDSKTSGGWYDDHVVQLLLSYIGRQHLRKYKRPSDMSEWQVYRPKDIPDQMNSCDCGVHICYWAHVVCSMPTECEIEIISPEVCQRIRPWILQEIVSIEVPERPKDPVETKDRERITALKKPPVIIASPPAGFASTLQYCASLISSLFKARDNTCAAQTDCKEPKEEMFFCEACRDWFHLLCLNDIPEMGRKEDYLCPVHRSIKTKKSKSRRQ